MIGPLGLAAATTPDVCVCVGNNHPYKKSIAYYVCPSVSMLTSKDHRLHKPNNVLYHIIGMHYIAVAAWGGSGLSRLGSCGNLRHPLYYVSCSVHLINVLTFLFNYYSAAAKGQCWWVLFL